MPRKEVIITQSRGRAKFPTSGSSFQSVQERLSKFERNAHAIAPDLYRMMSGGYPLTDLVGLQKVVKHALTRFMQTNRINPSEHGIREMEEDIVSKIGQISHSRTSNGLMTSGGTESNAIALLAAMGAAGGKRGSVVLPATAHSSFLKWCDWFGLKAISVPVREDFTVDPEKIRRAIRRDTIAIVANCGDPHWGVIDPIKEIGRVAEERSLYFHVDGAFGGLICPWLMRDGYNIPEFDFAVRGVSSVSADPHKTGFSVCPSGLLLFKDSHLMDTARSRKVHSEYQQVRDAPGLLGSRPGSTVAVTWAVFNYLGQSGFMKLSRECYELVLAFIEGVGKIPGLSTASMPKTNIANAVSLSFNMDLVKSRLREAGWFIFESKGPPKTKENALIVSFYPWHKKVLPKFLGDIEKAAKEATSYSLRVKDSRTFAHPKL